jgi:ABC-type transport system involved in multi-copper enzyme maturation permease subunit
MALAGGLLVALLLFALVEFRHQRPADIFFGSAQALSTSELSAFGNRFTLTVLFAQLGILFLLTPAYAAGAIAEEKERHTFTLLLVSDLTGWEIFAGLLAGRVVFLLTVLLAGLPVLALALLYGGVSLAYLGMCYLITAATVALLAALSAAGAAATATFRGALLRGYAFAALVATGGTTFLLSPFAVLGFLYELQVSDPAGFVTWGLAYAGAELLTALVAVAFGVRWVRQMRARPVYRAAPKRAVGLEPGRPPRRRDYHPPRPRGPRRAGIGSGDPFAWKERYIRGHKRTLDDDSLQAAMQAGGVVVAVLVGFLGLIAGVAILTTLGSGNRRGLDTAADLLATAGVLGHLPYLILVGAAAGRSVIVERQRNTLESLLAIPTDRGAILWPKWRQAVRVGLLWGVPTGFGLLAGLVLLGEPLAAAASALLVLLGGPLAASVGVWLSLRCQTATRALLWWLPVAGGLVFAQVLLFRLADVWSVPFAGLALAAGCGLAVWRFWAAATAAFERYGRN